MNHPRCMLFMYTARGTPLFVHALCAYTCVCAAAAHSITGCIAATICACDAVPSSMYSCCTLVKRLYTYVVGARACWPVRHLGRMLLQMTGGIEAVGKTADTADIGLCEYMQCLYLHNVSIAGHTYLHQAAHACTVNQCASRAHRPCTPNWRARRRRAHEMFVCEWGRCRPSQAHP
jgi:hypothetical protein